MTRTRAGPLDDDEDDVVVAVCDGTEASDDDFKSSVEPLSGDAVE